MAKHMSGITLHKPEDSDEMVTLTLGLFLSED
jgi:hypothetical protein